MTTARQTPSTRLAVIDTLRGVTIGEMIVTHFAGYFPDSVQKAIVYTETAMALFVVLAGFMVGWRIVEFARDPSAQARHLGLRAVRIYGVYLLLVATAGVAIYATGISGVAADVTWSRYLIDSLLVRNQIGLLHILPTFIPLFVVAPLVLWALARGHTVLLGLVSGGLLIAGHFDPDRLHVGAPAIFPFLMFQAYFVGGCAAGSWARRHGLPDARQAWRALRVALVALACTMAATHLKWLPAGTVQTHPLNIYGFFYHVPLVLTVAFGVLALEPNLRRMPGYGVVNRLGRHSMLAFVLHVYLAVTVRIIVHIHPLPMWALLPLLGASVLVMDFCLRCYERDRRRPAPSLATRNLAALLG